MKINRFALLAALALVLLNLAAPARPVRAATTFLVDTQNNTDEDIPGDCICADSNGDCSLPAAIQEADACPGADTIRLSHVAYQLEERVFEIHEDLTITNPLASFSAISNGSVARLFIVPSGVKLTLDAVKINYSGGIESNGQVWLYDCMLEDNQPDAGEDGGAIWSGSANGYLYIDHSWIGNNTAGTGADGGGIYSNSPTMIFNSFVYENSAVDGGGIYLAGGSQSIVLETRVNDNTATANGGGLYVVAGGYGASHSVAGSHIVNNEAQNGGGLFVTETDIYLTNTSLIANHATNNGGGLLITAQITYPKAYLTNVTVGGNAAENHGGGLCFGADTRGDLSNVTVTQNSADWSTTGVGNGSGDGGGIANLSQHEILLRNSVIAENSDRSLVAPPNYGKPDCDGLFTSGGYNLIGNKTCTVTAQSGDQFGNRFLLVDPLLGDRIDGADPNFTSYYPILAGSPLIDRANPTGCVDSDGDPITTDQLERPRPLGLFCDIGAFESSFSLSGIYLPVVLR
ncbi:MAG TPA: choice-of-anchor Q domain-containing protein [Anaerolineaceae bacterium]|nr:choice-of-anchor Q domain-containing protein [Anaerolineaceae bacterium]